MARTKTKAVEAEAETVKEKASTRTASKASAKKTETVYLQAGNSEWNISDCKERVAAAYVAEGHKASSIKNLVIYIKPEEGKAYYVINDSDNGSIDL